MWYLQHQHGQNVADAAAESGAFALANDQEASVSSAAVAAASGIPENALTVTTGVSTGVGNFTPGGTPANAVRAAVTQSFQPTLSGLFLTGPISISESAVALIIPATSTPCVLALATNAAEGVRLDGNAQVTCNGGGVASNTTSATSLGMNGNTSITATTVTTAGGCSGCTGHLSLTDPLQTYQPPTPDPFAAAQAVSLPTFSGSGCRPMPSLKGTVNLPPSTTQAFCTGQDLSITGNSVVNLSPGVYFFYGANISVAGSGSLLCPSCGNGQGVTLILTGPNNGAGAGTVSISGNTTVDLSAAASNAWNPAFNGILFYLDARSSNAVQISGGADMTLGGGLYFPSSSVAFSGGAAGASEDTCSVLVAATVTFNGNGNFGTNNCESLDMPTGSGQSVKLVQ